MADHKTITLYGNSSSLLASLEVKLIPRRIHRRQGGRCFYCDLPIEYKSPDYSVDHFFPKARGNKANLNQVVACKKCNGSKMDKDPDMEQVRRFVKLYNGIVYVYRVGGKIVKL